MKRKSITVTLLSIIAILLISFLVGTGFRKRTDVALLDYSVSDDGTKLTFQTAIPTSMGYIRGFVDDGGGVNPHYLTFYAAFGGFNSSFGAKNVFELDVREADTEIYFNRPEGSYELVLQRNTETGQWEKPAG